eukprot:411553-Rhodomonas_salina.2
MSRRGVKRVGCALHLQRSLVSRGGVEPEGLPLAVGTHINGGRGRMRRRGWRARSVLAGPSRKRELRGRDRVRDARCEMKRRAGGDGAR